MFSRSLQKQVTKVARDAELDRLKAAQDLAFQHKQSTYQTMQRAWDRRSAARDALNRAHEEKQRAYQAQDASWQDYQHVRSSNGPRIDQLNSQQENAYQNMKNAFDRASSAHDMRDGASARMYADEGHRYKQESQDCVTERRRLVQEIRDARDYHETTKPAFQRAKEEFSQAKQRFDQAKADHERAQADFKRAKAEFDQAVKAFQKRLEQVRAESKRKKDDKRSIAERAGVPYRYLDDVWVSKQWDGVTNIYFGGVGEPNGPGHGHYVVQPNGDVSYRRDPFDSHGAQNIVRDPQLESRLASVAMDAFHRDRSSTGPRRAQYNDGHVTVKVSSGFHRDTGAVATDIIVIDRVNAPGERFHMILSEHDGSVLYSAWHKNG